MARAYSALGQDEAAERTLKRAIAIKPDYWAGYNSLGAFYGRGGRYDDAIVQFEQVVRLTPDNTRGYNNLGAVYFLAGKWNDARQAWERSLAIDTTRVVCSQLGTLNFYTGRFADAAVLFRGALALSETDYRMWGNLAASLYWSPGKRAEGLATYAGAIEQAERQLMVNPQDEEVLTSLAVFHAMLGERESTQKLLGQVCALRPSNPDLMERIADAYEHIGARDSAVIWLCKAIEAGYSMRMLNASPGMRHLREDPRVRSVLEDRPG
jgi:serine/threonine-protein kinase